MSNIMPFGLKKESNMSLLSQHNGTAESRERRREKG